MIIIYISIHLNSYIYLFMKIMFILNYISLIFIFIYSILLFILFLLYVNKCVWIKFNNFHLYLCGNNSCNIALTFSVIPLLLGNKRKRISFSFALLSGLFSSIDLMNVPQFHIWLQKLSILISVFENN